MKTFLYRSKGIPSLVLVSIAILLILFYLSPGDKEKKDALSLEIKGNTIDVSTFKEEDSDTEQFINATYHKDYYERECLLLPKIQVSEDDNRLPSCPFISGDTYRSFCHHVFDEHTSYLVYEHIAKRIKKNELVFVATHMLKHITNVLLQNVKEPFILITSNSDHSAPEPYQNLLSFDKLIAWFPQNADMIHEKVHPLPIGLANVIWGHGNIRLISEMSNKRKKFNERKTLLYINMKLETDGARAALENRFRDLNNVKILKNRIPYNQYLEDLIDSKFVLSPRGNGLDCHRTWEALVMGAIPIVLDSTMNAVFNNTSKVIILKSWNDLTQEVLEQYQPGPDILPEIVYAKYWYDKIISHQIP
ncbi:hypothetical protein ROZALSC1DRAFT_29855 [Rozella allomycis CSF55]|uniref:RXYLT1 C-terminal domain-containing protein n=1 Tax=Rozella allomycis (strain CSF55) TaxID=988480 RepID=A0A4P9YIB8_ROZAC|nr:hypothetical protein ROZALSC1DRAFT_29855 [Rozella allomycis CSF55]